MAWTVDRSAGYEDWLKALTKRYKRAGDDIDAAFEQGKPQSDAIPGFGGLLWKARVASTDLGRGKSGSFRVIYYWNEESPNYSCLAACYFKGDYENLPVEEVRKLFVTVKARIDRIRAEAAKEAAKQSQPAADSTNDDPPF